MAAGSLCRRRSPIPPAPLLLFIFVLVAASKAPGGVPGEEWFEAQPSDSGERRLEEVGGAVGEEDTTEKGTESTEAIAIFGNRSIDPDKKPPNGYVYRVSEVDELDSEKGSVRAYVPFESLIYSVPSFALAPSNTQGGGAHRRAYSPKQVWLTPPLANNAMYRLSASKDFVIWADGSGRVFEMYRNSSTQGLDHRLHHNITDKEDPKINFILTTASPRYRVVGIDNEGKFLARCLRAKVSIDCTVLGDSGEGDAGYFWLDLGSAVRSYRFKGVVIVSRDSKHFFLLTTSGHLVSMDTRSRMAVWRTWGPPRDVSVEILADAMVASKRGVFVISSAGELWELDVGPGFGSGGSTETETETEGQGEDEEGPAKSVGGKTSTNTNTNDRKQSKSEEAPESDDDLDENSREFLGSESESGWTCHRYPEEAGPLALIESIAVEREGVGSSLFLVTKSGNLVEWRTRTRTWSHSTTSSKNKDDEDEIIHGNNNAKKQTSQSYWVNHGMPDSGSRIVAAPVAFTMNGVYYLFMPSADGSLQEFQIPLFSKNGEEGVGASPESEAKWVRHEIDTPLAAQRGAFTRSSLWFLQEDGALAERKFRRKRKKKKKKSEDEGQGEGEGQEVSTSTATSLSDVSFDVFVQHSWHLTAHESIDEEQLEDEE